ncbi:CsbD family protein [Terriglobus sp. RCC_193]|uniref:CsbD family protein n=1 Tax=Terriglobus sp. RCC_193 TaxID=3239218 RepID=UPI0035251E1B
MKAFPWLIAGLAVGAAAVVVAALNEPENTYSDPDVEHAANRIGAWGAKQRVKGGGESILGAAKQKFGEATGNYDLADEGAGEQTVGHIKDAAGKAADVVSDTIKDLNRP